jgi:hypothetical protein
VGLAAPHPRRELELNRCGARAQPRNLKTAVDGHEKALRSQNEKDGVETVVIHQVKVSVRAEPSFFCAFCAFSWLTVFSRMNFRAENHMDNVLAERLGHRRN